MDCCGSALKKIKTDWDRKLYFQSLVKLKLFEEILKYKTSKSASTDKACVVVIPSVVDVERGFIKGGTANFSS